MSDARCKFPSRDAFGRLLVLLALLLGCFPAHAVFVKRTKKTAEQLRGEYLTRIGQSWTEGTPTGTTGSLWTPNGILNNPATDYKAHALHDVLTVAVSVQTTAA